MAHDVAMDDVPGGFDREPDLADHLATAILVVGDHGELVRMNAAAENLLGVSVRQVMGSRVETLWPEAEALNLAIDEVAAGGQAMELRELALPLPARDQALNIDCIVSGLPTPAGSRKVIIEMHPDDRDRALVRDAEHEAQQRLAHRMVLNLAHELRNPLAGLRGAAQLLERNLPRADLKEYTRIIIGETDRLDTLVGQMLGPQQPPRRQMMNLHRPLEQVRRLVAASQENRLDIERDYDPSLPQLSLDPEQLTQALLNLLRNACQALAATPQPRIRLRTRIVHNLVIGGRSYRQCARISVIDNGPGVPADQAERIFFPMVSGHPERTGLGLAIARSLIGANGGRLDFISRPGRTEFMIDLPLNAAADDESDWSKG